MLHFKHLYSSNATAIDERVHKIYQSTGLTPVLRALLSIDNPLFPNAAKPQSSGKSDGGGSRVFSKFLVTHRNFFHLYRSHSWWAKSERANI